MKTFRFYLVTVAAVLLSALAQAENTVVVLGTATPGGGFQLYGQHLAEVLNEADPTLRIEARATRGSAENLPLLEAGKLDIGLVEGNAAQAAFAGAGQQTALQSVGLWSFVLARADLPDEVAYRLARAVHRGEAKLAARLAQGRYTTAANTANEVPRSELLHPGAARYLREIGALR